MSDDKRKKIKICQGCGLPIRKCECSEEGDRVNIKNPPKEDKEDIDLE